MAWIESHQSLARHRKTLRAAALLKVDRHKLIGHLHELWWWGLDNADQAGNLGQTPHEVIAEAAGWPIKQAEPFVDALIESGFIEWSEEGLTLHDWADYTGKWNDRRARNKERMRETRAQHVQRTDDAQPEHVAPTNDARAPNRARTCRATVPNQPDLTNRTTTVVLAAAAAATPRARGDLAKKDGVGNARVQAAIEAFRALGVDPSMGPRDYAALKHSTAPPELIAEVFQAVQGGSYGDEFMRKRLSVHEAIEWVNGYQARSTSQWEVVTDTREYPTLEPGEAEAWDAQWEQQLAAMEGKKSA